MRFFSQKVDIELFTTLDLDAEAQKLNLQPPQDAVIALSSVSAIALTNKHIVVYNAYFTEVGGKKEYCISLTTFAPSYKNFSDIYERSILNIDHSMMTGYVLFETEEDAANYVERTHKMISTHFPTPAEKTL